LVVTEGEVTEPQYLHGFVSWLKNPRVEIRVVGGAGAPRTIVEEAKSLKKQAETSARREKDENLKYDDVWCVFDVDEHPKIPGAMQMARDNKMSLAISNPCFELWLWLHIEDQPGMQHRHSMQDLLSQKVPGYSKHVNFQATFASGYESAVQRARRLDEAAERDNDAGRNPTTGVWLLTESIRQGST
jgi:hypothetical protein